MSKLLLTGVAGLILAIGFTGCSPANIQAQMRVSEGTTNMKTRCEEVDMRDNDDMQELFTKYDGWKVFYISEYTTENKFGTSGNVCFEQKN